jgi:hypothetical protein
MILGPPVVLSYLCKQICKVVDCISDKHVLTCLATNVCLLKSRSALIPAMLPRIFGSRTRKILDISHLRNLHIRTVILFRFTE